MAPNADRSVLSREYVVECLLFMLENKEVVCGDLSKIIKSGNTRKQTIKLMKEAGLVSVEVVNRPRKTYRITLTAIGAKVAQKISEAYDALSGNTEDVRINHSTPGVEGDTANTIEH